jgi:nucleoside-diphosphate kinase
MKQATFVLFKPDAVERRLVGRILARFEDAGLQIGGLKDISFLPRHTLEAHYAEHAEKPFFNRLVSSMERLPAIAMVLWGPDAIRRVRAMIGTTNALESPPGTIRGDLGMDVGSRNLVHASDSEESAKREIQLWFHFNGDAQDA